MPDEVLTVTIVSVADGDEITARFSSSDPGTPDRLAVLTDDEIEILTAVWAIVGRRGPHPTA